jgi:hypothetical protein
MFLLHFAVKLGYQIGRTSEKILVPNTSFSYLGMRSSVSMMDEIFIPRWLWIFEWNFDPQRSGMFEMLDAVTQLFG